MIRVIVKENKDNKITSIEVKGHAYSGESGKDLVCAGASAVITGAFNSIKEPKKFLMVLEEGHALIEAKEEISNHDEIVLETLFTSLKTFEEGYKEFISIKIQ